VAFYSEKLQRAASRFPRKRCGRTFRCRKCWPAVRTDERLYGITVRERDGVSVWHPSVRYYDLLDSAADRRRFHLDPYSGAKAQRRLDGRVRVAKNASARRCPWRNSCATYRPVVGSLVLTHDEVTTLFHEFGHGLHHMLTQVAYRALRASTASPGRGGVAEPVHGEFRLAARSRALISAHVTTGEPLPLDALQRLLGTRTFNAALDTLRQIELASFDFEMHANFDPALGARVAETLAGVRSRVAVVPAASFNRMPSSFAHIFAGGYAAGYYSYKWAEVLAADAFEASRKRVCSTPRRPLAFVIRFWRAAAAWMPWTRSYVFAGAGPMCGRC